MTRYAYGRVSTSDQTTETQLRAFLKEGIEPENIFTENKSGVKRRPQLEKLLSWIEEGDEIYITKFDRLGRNLRDLQDITTKIESKGASLNVGGTIYDPNDPFSRVFFQIMGAFAEFERNLIAQRTSERLAAIRESGGKLGRPSAINTEQQELILRMLNDGYSKSDIAKATSISRSSIYRCLQKMSNEEEVSNDPQIQRLVNQAKIATRKQYEKKLAKYAAEAEAIRERSKTKQGEDR